MCTFLQAFPVTEEVEQASQAGQEFHVLGVIERKAILKMLQHRIGFCGNGRQYKLPTSTQELLDLLVSFEQRPIKADSPEDQAVILRYSCLIDASHPAL
jgi:hypothetical protein